jgi:hypothetical protein
MPPRYPIERAIIARWERHGRFISNLKPPATRILDVSPSLSLSRELSRAPREEWHEVSRKLVSRFPISDLRGDPRREILRDQLLNHIETRVRSISNASRDLGGTWARAQLEPGITFSADA